MGQDGVNAVGTAHKWEKSLLAMNNHPTQFSLIHVKRDFLFCILAHFRFRYSKSFLLVRMKFACQFNRNGNAIEPWTYFADHHQVFKGNKRSRQTKTKTRACTANCRSDENKVHFAQNNIAFYIFALIWPLFYALVGDMLLCLRSLFALGVCVCVRWCNEMAMKQTRTVNTHT